MRISHPKGIHYRYRRRHRSRRQPNRWMVAVGLLLLAAGWYYFVSDWGAVVNPTGQPVATPGRIADSGKVLSVEAVQTYPAEQAGAIARENYGAVAPPVETPVTKITFKYRSYDLNGSPLVIYGRAYVPEAPANFLPILAFAPGTTGIGDQCAGSLEQPHVSNWANYDSHLVMYASQGYASVITDYEGMRDSSRLHHYMIGELEGRAVLDSIRALRQLPQTSGRLDRQTIFASGYSQGGHAAFWADKIQPTYAPELPLKGVIGFGPVMSVKQTLADVTHGANINWFGPFVLTSYSDYYQRSYNAGNVLLPRWSERLSSDVQGHCIDSVLRFWGHSAPGVYAPPFIQAMSSGDWKEFAALERDLDRNLTGDQTTGSAKRINQGQLDNVVLTSQQQAILPTLCAKSRGPVQLHIYPTATHYNTMVLSLHDTLAWMQQLRKGPPPASTCPQR